MKNRKLNCVIYEIVGFIASNQVLQIFVLQITFQNITNPVI